jgi:hypothetical protein
MFIAVRASEVSRVQKEGISAWLKDTYIKAAPTFAEAITAFRTNTPPHIEAAVFEQVEYQFSYKVLKHGGCHIKSKLIPPELLALSVGPLTASTAPGSVAERLATSAPFRDRSRSPFPRTRDLRASAGEASQDGGPSQSHQRSESMSMSL